MELEEAIRTRRTHKAYRPEPVEPEVIAELLELARWAPNHHLTNPWRFRVVGPRALARLQDVSGPAGAGKLERAPTLIVCTAVTGVDPLAAEEDLHATACAVYAVLLGAHARGLAAYWRTPAVLRDPAGLEAVEVGPQERFVAMIYLGRPVQDQRPPERDAPSSYVSWLD